MTVHQVSHTTVALRNYLGLMSSGRRERLRPSEFISRLLDVNPILIEPSTPELSSSSFIFGTYSKI